MVLRFCEKCAAEVEDVGGFCLLGHPLRLDPAIPSVSHVRNEVDRVLDEVRLEGSPAAPEGPAQPPPPPAGGEARPSLWASLDDERSTRSADPIEAFAPPPRMDWGPEERASLLQRGLRRRQRVAHA